jgi:hypothetical protein
MMNKHAASRNYLELSIVLLANSDIEDATTPVFVKMNIQKVKRIKKTMPLIHMIIIELPYATKVH